MPRREFYTTAEVALVLEVTAGRIRQLFMGDEPELKSSRFGRDRLIKHDDLMAYIERKNLTPNWDALEDTN